MELTLFDQYIDNLGDHLRRLEDGRQELLETPGAEKAIERREAYMDGIRFALDIARVYNLVNIRDAVMATMARELANGGPGADRLLRAVDGGCA